MTSIKDLNNQLKSAASESQTILAKVQDVQYKMKVAEVQNDEVTINGLKAEVVVLTQMMKEKTDEINKIQSKIESLKSGFEHEASEHSRFKNVALGVSLLCFVMPSFGIGFVYFLVCMGVAYFYSTKAADQKAYAAGYTEAEWKETKKQISDKINREQRDRDALAKSIADQLKK